MQVSCASFEGRDCSGFCSAKEVGSFIIREMEMRYYRKIFLWHGLLTCNFMFRELIAYFFFFNVYNVFLPNSNSVAVVTSSRKRPVLC